MALVYDSKFNVDDVSLSEDGWSKEEDPSGKITYTSTSDTASATIKFRPPREDKIHDPCKIGSKVIVQTNGRVDVEQKK